MQQNRSTQENSKRIIVYTDHPESYHCENIFRHLDVEFCSCPEEFCCSMLKRNYSGQILDMRKVMGTPCCVRNRILSFTASTPTMRAMVRAKEPVYLDSRDKFLCDCLENGNFPTGSSCPLTVNIPVEISLDHDPAMVESFKGTIHDITENGCTFHTQADLSANDFLYLKLRTLENSLPLYAGVCCIQDECMHSCGYKVRFLDIKHDQREEITRKYLKA